MTIAIACPHCHEPLKVPRESQGKRILCPHCQNQAMVPQLETSPSPQVHQAEPLPKPRTGKGLGIASMVVGIVSIVFSCIPLLGFILSVVAVSLGVASAKQASRRNGFATAGLVLGTCGFVLSILIFIVSLTWNGFLQDQSNERDARSITMRLDLAVADSCITNSLMANSLTIGRSSKVRGFLRR